MHPNRASVGGQGPDVRFSASLIGSHLSDEDCADLDRNLVPERGPQAPYDARRIASLAGLDLRRHLLRQGVRSALLREFLTEVLYLSQQKGHSYIRQAVLGARLGVCPRTVRALQHQAVEAGYVRVQRTGGANKLHPDYQALGLIVDDVSGRSAMAAERTGTGCRSLIETEGESGSSSKPEQAPPPAPPPAPELPPADPAPPPDIAAPEFSNSPPAESREGPGLKATRPLDPPPGLSEHVRSQWEAVVRVLHLLSPPRSLERHAIAQLRRAGAVRNAAGYVRRIIEQERDTWREPVPIAPLPPRADAVRPPVDPRIRAGVSDGAEAIAWLKKNRNDPNYAAQEISA